MVFYMVFLTSKSSGNLFWGKKSMLILAALITGILKHYGLDLV